MKKGLLLFALCAFVSFNVSAARRDTLRILAIGNSFSEDAVEQNLHEIARADAHCAIIGNMYIGGCSLERHHKNMKEDAPAYRYRKIDNEGVLTTIKDYKLSQALADEKWDVVTLQQQSSKAGQVATYEPYLTELIEYIRSVAPKGVKIFFHQTWAYASGSTNPGFTVFGNDQKVMYDSIMVATHKACQKHKLEVIPVGTAVQNARPTNIRDNFTRDGYHLNHSVGRYTAALTWYESIFKRPVTGNLYRPYHVSAEQALICQVAAHSACLKPYETTPLGFPTPKGQYREDRIPAYTLPDALTMNDGTPVTSREQWTEKRRPELLEMFANEVYGKAPEKVNYQEFEVLEVKKDALNGLATRKRVAIYLTSNHRVWMDVIVYTPNTKKKNAKCPVFLGINFWGNHAITEEQDIYIPVGADRGRFGRYEDMGRGYNARRWPLETILKAGYGVVTYYRGDVEPDFDDTAALSVQHAYPKNAGKQLGPDQWGSIAVWAWSLSRAMDYIETDPNIDAGRVAIFGHSRLGKAALWAGAQDERFAMVISNESGCGGAAISRRAVGETVGIINRSFPHWFCENFKIYGENEAALPVDQHELLALIAPRPLCVGSADGDIWSDPEGERLSLEAAKPVYELFGKGTDMLQYHTRPGKHDVMDIDWENYINHANKYLK